MPEPIERPLRGVQFFSSGTPRPPASPCAARASRARVVSHVLQLDAVKACIFQGAGLIQGVVHNAVDRLPVVAH